MVLVVNPLNLHGDLLNLIEPGIVHSLLKGVFPDELFNVQTCLLQIDLKQVYFFSEVQDSVLINITFDPE